MNVILQWVLRLAGRYLPSVSTWWIAGIAAVGIAAGGFWAGHTWATGVAALDSQKKYQRLISAYTSANNRLIADIDQLQIKLAERERDLAESRRKTAKLNADFNVAKETDNAVKKWSDIAAPDWINNRLRDISAGRD